MKAAASAETPAFALCAEQASKQAGIVENLLPTFGQRPFPNPVDSVTPNHTRMGLDLNDVHALRRQHHEINFVDGAILSNELEVGPSTIKVAIREEKLPGKLQRFPLPCVIGLGGFASRAYPSMAVLVDRLTWATLTCCSDRALGKALPSIRLR